jgi:hypothetical protein
MRVVDVYRWMKIEEMSPDSAKSKAVLKG